MTNTKTVAFHTLGCKLNFSETSTIARMFLDNGYQRVEFEEPSDVVVINTCSVTEVADKKCRQAIKKAIKNSPNAIVAVIGCYAQLKPYQISNIEGVDIILDTKEKFKLLDYINNKENKIIAHPSNVKDIDFFQPSWSFGDRTRTFFKVQDGCDYFCSYCTIPLARGKSRNNSISETIKVANEIAGKGVKEVILTGINLGDFGKSTNESFLDLIKELEKVKGIERYRLSSIEPNLLTDEIIEFVAKSKKIMPHFHIPLQSGCDKVLKLMGRKYDTQLFKDRIHNIKKLIPTCFIGVDVIVGVSGETKEDFNETARLVESLDISELHVFSYSERNHTKAIHFDGKVSSAEKKIRSNILHDLSSQKLKKFYSNNLKKTASVLFEDFNDNGLMYGFTENYTKVETTYNKELANKILSVKLKEITSSGNVSITF